MNDPATMHACLGRGSIWLLTIVWLVVACVPTVPTTPPSSTPPLPRYSKALTLMSGNEWRFTPLAIDLNGDGFPDLVATSRLQASGLYMWLGNGKNFIPVERTWSDTGYAALVAGDVNHDGFPDIVGVSHFGRIQTLLSNGKGGFTETVVKRADGYVAAQLADVNGDGELDLVLVGYATAAIEIYLGDGKGNWKLHSTLPVPKPGRTMPGRALVVADLNHDGHSDIVAVFQRWGLYIYYGDGRGGFTGGLVDFIPPSAFQTIDVSLAVADVNRDGHLDLVINGTAPGKDGSAGPDVYLGDGRGGWTSSSMGLKVLQGAGPGVAVGDLDGDGHLDIVGGGLATTIESQSAYGLFLFRGDGKGRWQFVPEKDSGLPAQGLTAPHGVALADLERRGVVDIISVHGGGPTGAINIWKRQSHQPAR